MFYNSVGCLGHFDIGAILTDLWSASGLAKTGSDIMAYSYVW